MHSRLLDMKSKIIDENDETFHKPSEEEVEETTEATRQALEKIVTTKVSDFFFQNIFGFFTITI